MSQKKVNLKVSSVEPSSNFLVTGSNILPPPFLKPSLFFRAAYSIQENFHLVTLPVVGKMGGNLQFFYKKGGDGGWVRPEIP